MLAQHREGQGLAPHQRVLGCGHDGQRVGGKRRGHAVQLGRGAAHHHQIHLKTGQQAQHVFAVVNFELHVNARKQLVEVHQQHGNEVFGGADHGQVHAAFFQAHMLGHGGFQVFELTHGRGRVGQKSLTGVGELDVAPLRLNQRQTKGVFQLANLHGHRGLGHKQPLGGLGDRSLARHLHEGLDLFQGVGAHAGLHCIS